MTICPNKLSVGTDANYDTIHYLFFPIKEIVDSSRASIYSTVISM